MNNCARFSGAALALFTAATATHAADTWTSKDKPQHFGVSALAGTVATGFVKSDNAAFALAMLPGVLKEVADSREAGNHFSGKDLAWDALGAYAGVKFGRFVATYSNGRTSVTFAANF